MPHKDKTKKTSSHLDLKHQKVSPTYEGLRGTNQLIKVENVERELASLIHRKMSLVTKKRLEEAALLIRSDSGSQKLRKLTNEWKNSSPSKFIYWSLPFLYRFEDSKEILSNCYSRRFLAIKNVAEQIRSHKRIESQVKSLLFLLALEKGNRASQMVACYYFFALSPEADTLEGEKHMLPIAPYSKVAIDLIESIIQQDEYDNALKLNAIVTLESLYPYVT